MPDISLNQIVKLFGTMRATDEVDLDIRDGEFVTLLGPSGCGKTTLLRSIAGLERIDEGQIRIGSRIVADPAAGVFVPPEKRDLGMVFQSYALWPHMSVWSNIAYPLKTRKSASSKQISERVGHLMEVVGLGGMRGRLISELSGGQQQRVALARALAGGSELVLYDEPLSNLDAGMRVSMRNEIRKVHDEIGTTSVFVTHDQEEALALSDRVVLLQKGKIVQQGTPHEVYAAPRNAFVADFLGFENIFRTSYERIGDEEMLRVAAGAITLPVSQYSSVTPDHEGFAIKASHIRVGGAVRAGEEEIFFGRVTALTYMGDRSELTVEVNGQEVHALVMNHLLDGELLPGEGETVPLQFPAALVAPLEYEA